MITITADSFNKNLSWLGLSISKDATAVMSRRVLRLYCDGSALYGYTYDGENNIKVKFCDCNDTFDIYVDYINMANFTKYCEGDITLKYDINALTVKSSNVKCKMPLYDAKANIIDIPDPVVNSPKYDKDFEINFKLNTLKTVLDTTHTVEVYRKICFNDQIVAFNDNDAIFINNRVFSNNFLLNAKSVDILCTIGSGKYSYDKEVVEINGTNEVIRYLCVEHENINARILIDTSEYPYDELVKYVNDIVGTNVHINGNTLVKAINASKLFKMIPTLTFSSKGVYLVIDSVGFEYKISDDSCEDVKIQLTDETAKKLCAINDDMYVYYNNCYEYEGKTYNTLKCSSKDIEELISVNAGD